MWGASSLASRVPGSTPNVREAGHGASRGAGGGGGRSMMATGIRGGGGARTPGPLGTPGGHRETSSARHRNGARRLCPGWGRPVPSVARWGTSWPTMAMAEMGRRPFRGPPKLPPWIPPSSKGWGEEAGGWRSWSPIARGREAGPGHHRSVEGVAVRRSTGQIPYPMRQKPPCAAEAKGGFIRSEERWSEQGQRSARVWRSGVCGIREVADPPWQRLLERKAGRSGFES